MYPTFVSSKLCEFILSQLVFDDDAVGLGDVGLTCSSMEMLVMLVMLVMEMLVILVRLVFEMLDSLVSAWRC